MTALSISLTETLTTKLTNPGAYAYAVYFAEGTDGTIQPFWTTLVDNGVVQGTGSSATLDLPEPYNGGKVYVLVQSQSPTATQTDLTSIIIRESDINWENAKTNQYRVDSFEVSLLNQTGDAGNLTSVQGFGLPMELYIPYGPDSSDTLITQSRGYDVDGETIFTSVSDIHANAVEKFTTGPLAGTYRAAISPAEAVALAEQNQIPDVFSQSDWTAYVDSLKKDTGIMLSGFFNGAADANGIYHNGGFFGYGLEWSETDNAFWLNPVAESHIKGSIKITAEQLANSIYSTLGNVEIYSNRVDATPYTIQGASSSEMNTGANNQWGTVLTQILTGLTGGYYGTSGKSLNANVTESIDLNKNWNWDPTYAFGKNLSGDAAVFQDPYAELFFFKSNSYGSGYSDNLMSAYAEGGPLIPVYYNGANVQTIDLTIYDDSETPSGYTQPVIYNYIAPPGHSDLFRDQIDATSYSPADLSNLKGANISLNFFNQNIILKDDTPVALKVFVGNEEGIPTFRTIEFQPAANETLWQNWTIQDVGGVWEAQSGPAQTDGAMVISNIPIAENGTVWYQLVIGSGDTAKAVNVYAETKDSLFVNPAVSGQSDSVAADGLVMVSPESSSADTIVNFALDFLYSGSTTLHPSLFTWNSSKTHLSQLAEPTAVVAGVLEDSGFEAITGQTSVDTNAVTTNQSSLVFGWTGENPNATSGTNEWLKDYTNKISAKNLAQITFMQTGSPDLAPVLATADIDGRWSTATGKALGNGTYTVLMTEYFNTSNQVGSQIGRKSKELSVTVALDELSLAQSSTNSGLTFETTSNSDSQSGGNWVEFTLGAQGPASGSAVLLYVVDASGNYVGRDGATSEDVTLADAIRGVLGAGQSGAAAAQQSVYLEAGQEIRFAQLTGQDRVDTSLSATFQVAASGGYDITLGDVRLSAVVQNTLDEAAILADAQRQTDIPLVFLEQGTLHDITMSGTSTSHHKFGFVRVDVGTDGSLKIDGKTLAEVRALGANAKDLVDGGFEYLYSGSAATAAWTVSGATGFYAPIFFSDDGSPHFIGESTLDGVGQIRILGENTFGLENSSGAAGAAPDFEDLVIAFDTGRSATGNDLVAGSGNDDVLLGSVDNYALYGGKKLDTVVYDRTKDEVGLSGTRSGVTVADGDGADTLVAVELVVFTGANGTGQDRVLVINPDSSMITGSYGFNEAVYLKTHADVAAAVAAGAFSSGAEHYTLHGNSETRVADLLFDAEFYLADNADVATAIAAGIFASASEHYELFGSSENRSVNPLFDAEYYLAQNMDVAEAIANDVFASAYEHFLNHGDQEGRSASIYFDTATYRNEQELDRNTSALEHFLLIGLPQGITAPTAADFNSSGLV
ncbi:MAG: hypothetical protein ABJQ21_25630 [Roseibium sp.]